MLEALEGAQPARDRAQRVRCAMRLTRQHHGKRRRERIRDIVIADEAQVAARQQWLAQHLQHAARVIHPRVASPADGEPAMNPRRRLRQCLDDDVIAVRHPMRCRRRVAKEQRLVGVILLDAVISVEMIARQIGEHADPRRDAWRVVQLER